MAYMTDENGNYKRTVRCGHCYEKGHNKSACPERKKSLAENVERYTKELAENKFETDWQKKNVQRHLDRSKQELHKMATRGQNRKCGFCSEPGHTRRTCPERKAQTSSALAKTLDIRKRVADRMVANNFGPGSLIEVGTDSQLAVVSHVNFNDIAPSHAVSKDSYFYGCQAIRFQYVVPKEDSWGGRPITNGSCYVPLEYMNVDDLPRDEWHREPNNKTCTLLSGVNVSEDIFLTDETFGDKKKVEKWVINTLVDPK